MKRIGYVFLLLAIAIAGPGCQKPEEEDPVIARINSTEVRRSQLDAVVQRNASILQQQGKPVPPDIYQQAFNMLIRNELLYQEGLKLDVPELQQTIEQRYREFVARFPSEEVFLSSLRQANMPPERVRDNIRREVIIANLIENKIGKNITIPDEEAKKYYKENREELRKPETVTARQILISLPPSPTEEEEMAAQEKIAEIKKKLKEGESFEELAMAYSDHPTSAQGGDMGTFTRGVTEPEFEEAVFSAKKGRVIGPVKTSLGLHLVRVEAREKSRIPKFREVKDQITEKLRRDRINDRLVAFLDDLAARSIIETSPQQPRR